MPIVNHTKPRQLPTNQRAIDPAKRALDLLAPYQQKKYEAAFHVNPIEVLLYSKLNGGLECSCTFGDHEAPPAPLLGVDGKASQETIQTLLTGKRFGISEYATTNNADPNRLNGKQTQIDPDQTQIPSLTYVGRSETDPRRTVSDRHTNSVGADYVLDGLEDESPPDLPSEENESPQLNRPLRSTDNRSCPICFGSGYVGGYSIHNGWRRVYDGRDSSIQVHAGEIDSTAAPYRMKIAGNGWVEFAVTLPANIKSYDAFRVMDGKFPAKNTELYSRPVGSQSLTLLNSNLLLKSISSGTEIVIRITSLDKLNIFQFTHLEIQCNLSSTPLLAEFPRLGETSDLNILDRTQDIQVNFTNKVVSLHTEDLLYDLSVSKLWRISAAQYYRDHAQNVIGWDCNANVIQPYETQMILPKRYTQNSNHQRNNTPLRQTRKR